MAKKQTYQSPQGMHDIMPAEQHVRQHFLKAAESIASFYNFQKIDTPILENSELFEKGTGQGTDIVQKEMYTLRTKGGDSLTLRPEGTPAIVRSYIQHGMKKWSSPVKLFYYGPMFRHEKPQRGRFRQFYHFGLETIGEDEPARDAEIIHILFKIFEKLRLTSACVEVNSIGCKECRPKYIKALKEHYRYKLKQVCAECRKRYKTSPLRLLDCEDEKCQRVKMDVPHIVDYLCGNCNTHFKKVLDTLDSLNIPYLLNPLLVRGLDYYTRTVFEMFDIDVSESSPDEVQIVEEKQKRLAIASGGRYDDLVKFLGGPATPAVGAAIGVERAIAALERSGKLPKKPAYPRVFLVQLGEAAKKKSLSLFEDFRKAGIPVKEAFGRESISAQLKMANKFNADIAVIIGQKEVLDNVAIIREMDTGSQETIPQEKLINEVKKRLAKKK